MLVVIGYILMEVGILKAWLQTCLIYKFMKIFRGTILENTL